jgi:AraC-like DNA-binding protein
MKRKPRPSRRAIRAAIDVSFKRGGASLQCTARQLGISVRLLQRSLAEAGTSYREELDRARVRAACHLLAHSKERICDIGTQLGFSDASSFSRTFMRLMKIQPRVFRRQQVAEHLGQKRPSRRA